MLRDVLQTIGKAFFRNSESEPEMLRHSEAIARSKERPPFSHSTTEFPRIAAAL
jgi:hypothetical protein